MVQEKRARITIYNAEKFIECQKRSEMCRAILRKRYRGFVRALKRLGIDDCECEGLESLPPQDVTEEIRKIVSEEGVDHEADLEGFWDLGTVEVYLFLFKYGVVPIYHLDNETLNEKIDSVIIESLGGNPLNEEIVTPRAVYDLLDDETKAGVPVYSIRSRLDVIGRILSCCPDPPPYRSKRTKSDREYTARVKRLMKDPSKLSRGMVITSEATKPVKTRVAASDSMKQAVRARYGFLLN